MKAIALGAVLGLVWLAFGLPLALPTVAVSTVLQPVVLAFAAGLLTRPMFNRMQGARS